MSWAVRRGRRRGYTLIELMAVVSIVGILAALATYGVRTYLAAAKTSEAKNTVGAISRSAAAAYERVRSTADAVVTGGDATSLHALCATSTLVPGTMDAVKGRKYQPSSAEGSDFQTGDDSTGWKCLRFSYTNPIYYQYSYTAGSGDWSGGLAGDYFVARAQGDLDGDGIYARFVRGGQVSSGILTLQTTLWSSKDSE